MRVRCEYEYEYVGQGLGSEKADRALGLGVKAAGESGQVIRSTLFQGEVEIRGYGALVHTGRGPVYETAKDARARC